MQKIVRCNPIFSRVIPVLNKKEYFERKSAHSVCESAGTPLTLKQSSGQTLNHTKEIPAYARIVVTTAGFEPTSPSLVTWRVPYSISPCVCLVGFTLNLTQTEQDGSELFQEDSVAFKDKRKDKQNL